MSTNLSIPQGCIRIAKGYYTTMDIYETSECNKACSDLINESSWGNSKYHKIEVHHINPTDITNISTRAKRYEAQAEYKPYHQETIIHLKDGEEIKVPPEITRDRIIECANEALATGKTIDLTA